MSIDETESLEKDYSQLKDKFKVSDPVDQPVGIPFIDERSYRRLLVIYGMAPGSITSAGLRNMHGQSNRPLYLRALDLTETVYKSLHNPDNASNIQFQIEQALDGAYRNHPYRPQFIDASLVGMVMVINAVQAQVGGDFLDDLRGIRPDLVFKAFNNALGRSADFRERISIVDRVKHVPVVPRYQVHLNSIIWDFINQHVQVPLENTVVEEAGFMYKALDQLWPELEPQLGTSKARSS